MWEIIPLKTLISQMVSSTETETSSGFKQMKADQRKHKIEFAEKMNNDLERKSLPKQINSKLLDKSKKG